MSGLVKAKFLRNAPPYFEGDVAGWSEAEIARLEKLGLVERLPVEASTDADAEAAEAKAKAEADAAAAKAKAEAEEKQAAAAAASKPAATKPAGGATTQ